MTLYQFNKLEETEQLNILLSHGTMVARRRDKKYKFVLYQLDNIYIELQYHKDHMGNPSIRGFTSTGKSLIPYLENIDVSGLLKL